VVASLLRVRRHNEDQGAAHLRLFESASAFHFGVHGHIERATIALLADAPAEARDSQGAYRLMRGVVERVLQLVAPRSARVEFAPQGADGAAWLSVGARVLVNEIDVGCVGIVDARIAKAHGVERPTAAAELELRGLLSAFPPQNAAVDLPAFPAADRDISAIVAETVRYGDIEREIHSLKLANLEEIAFVTTFRGKQIGEGKKSVSLRLVFRKHDGTMTSEEADASVGRAIVHLREALGAEVRS
jgi:phenylalanyl-tRNA synthetase beta chain